MNNSIFKPCDILLPKPNIQLEKWAVLACDQFTSEPEYWHKVESIVGDAPSTLNMILPEVYLEGKNMKERILKIHSTMIQYKSNILKHSVTGFVFTTRATETGVRFGLVGCVDLEDYSYEKNSSPRIRPSENTVVERIPPRLAVRRGALLESPHILMLVDDVNKTVIEPIEAKMHNLERLYGVNLMLGGGYMNGWAVTDKKDIENIQNALAKLEDEEYFSSRYPGAKTSPFALCVGDGNHSLATAKAAWEELKSVLPQELLATHPARYCLVELQNIQSHSINIEPIHRVVFGVSGEEVLSAAKKYAESKCGGYSLTPGQHSFNFVFGDTDTAFSLSSPAHPLPVGSVDDILTLCAEENPNMKVDYVHGEDSVRALAKNGAVGILLGALKKSDLFKGVALGGVLPKKTFSMGHAHEKRYYMECREIS